MTSNLPSLKYPRPKILLVDMGIETEVVLKSAGHNVSVGSFGVPYKVPKRDDIFPVIVNGKLPVNASEQEIVIIDLVASDILNQPEGEKHTSQGENDWWVSSSRGKIDPRPRLMAAYQNDFDRILSYGGVFIIFADARYLQKIAWGHIDNTYAPVRLDFCKIEDIPCDNWCFLSIFKASNLVAISAQGEEISVVVKSLELNKFFSKHFTNAEFLCTFNSIGLGKRWVTLAENKYGEPVAGVIQMPDAKGQIFIFPQLQDKSRFIVEFLNDFLPDLSPHLFPNVEGGRWVERSEYELPQVLEFKKKIQQIEEEVKTKVAKLEEAIEKEQSENAYLYDLIRENSTLLVSAVNKALEVLGFQSVIDVDKEMEKAGDTRPKREDLQIKDGSPILLVEVKGISGLPMNESLQALKYLAPRMKEWNRTDIQALSIINHQRNIPPLDRENENPFREDNLINAQEHGFGLLTTWDLFRLTRSYLKNRWKHEHIKPLFYQKGRIQPVPKHYEFIGTVQRFIPKIGVVGVQIEAANLKHGDRIAFELTVEFEEQEVESLEVDNQPVAQAEIGMLAGIKTHLTKQQLKEKVRVFRLVKIII
ncbi:MAG: hypothetical protein KME57_17930 [Scytonema hyalinum WJT4-NPBG1]|jgi:hypothetical protein|nr:hypothetical protein [Scytonema hyalinum WJT4-NPBG1]